MRREVGKLSSEIIITFDGGFVFTATKDTKSHQEHTRKLVSSEQSKHCDCGIYSMNTCFRAD